MPSLAPLNGRKKDCIITEDQDQESQKITSRLEEVPSALELKSQIEKHPQPRYNYGTPVRMWRPPNEDMKT